MRILAGADVNDVTLRGAGNSALADAGAVDVSGLKSAGQSAAAPQGKAPPPDRRPPERREEAAPEDAEAGQAAGRRCRPPVRRDAGRRRKGCRGQDREVARKTRMFTLLGAAFPAADGCRIGGGALAAWPAAGGRSPRQPPSPSPAPPATPGRSRRRHSAPPSRRPRQPEVIPSPSIIHRSRGPTIGWR